MIGMYFPSLKVYVSWDSLKFFDIFAWIFGIYYQNDPSFFQLTFDI